MFVSVVLALSWQVMNSAVQLYGYSLLMLAVFAYLDRKQKTTYPLLLMILIYRTLFTLTAVLFLRYSHIFLFLVGVNELIFLWIFSKFYKSEALKSLVGSQVSMPNLQHYYWLLGLVAVNGFYKLAAGFEVYIHINFKGFFENDFIPFFFTTGNLVTTSIRFAIDFLVMSVVLKSLQKK